MNNNWVFTGSTNSSMDNLIGEEVMIYTPHRNNDGHTVLYVTDPENRDNWYFYTSTIVSIERVQNYEKGFVNLTVKTHNSTYRFYKKC